jgi:hypothetical protein
MLHDTATGEFTLAVAASIRGAAAKIASLAEIELSCSSPGQALALAC